jgi:hypothetical protein
MATPARLETIKAASDNSLDRLENQTCANLFAGASGDPIGTAENEFEATSYRIVDLASSSSGAQTVDSTTVFLNASGAFFTTAAPDGTVTVKFGNDAASKVVVFASVAVFDAALLLHEFGHQTDVYGKDLGTADNLRNTMTVLDACFSFSNGVCH